MFNVERLTLNENGGINVMTQIHTEGLEILEICFPWNNSNKFGFF